MAFRKKREEVVNSHQNTGECDLVSEEDQETQECPSIPAPPQPGSGGGRKRRGGQSPWPTCAVSGSPPCKEPQARRRRGCTGTGPGPGGDRAHGSPGLTQASTQGGQHGRRKRRQATAGEAALSLQQVAFTGGAPRSGRRARTLRDFEASFIRLLDKITNGSRIEINQTGTTLYYQPGLLCGGSVEHDCNVLRSIGYYLESLLCLAPFMKHPLRIVLRGVTNDQVDPSVVRRGMPPGGGGEVLFSCPVRKVLKPVQLTDPGKIKRIRGIAYPLHLI
ncbi:hypothetical protein GH733_016096 [Mirounga leonina]|nr:hypothetical protein GH733_016096 [Mirounga leonina]